MFRDIQLLRKWTKHIFGGNTKGKVNSYSMLQHILSMAPRNLKQLGNAVQQNAILIVARGMLNWAWEPGSGC